MRPGAASMPASSSPASPARNPARVAATFESGNGRYTLTVERPVAMSE